MAAPPFASTKPFTMLPDALLRSVIETVGRPETAGPVRMLDWWDETIGEPLWSKQREIMSAVEDHRYVAVASCHGAGKSSCASRMALAFLHTRPHSIVLTTAPTGAQVRNILWRYIRAVAARHEPKLLGRAMQQEYQIAPDWYGIGFKPADQETDRFQGIHAADLLVIIDEAAGVPDQVIDVLHAAMTSRHARFLMIGNPTSISGRFREAFHERSNVYHTIRIAASDTPNFTGESAQPGMAILQDQLITPQFVAEEVALHGLGSDYVRSRIHAEFPLGTVDTLISLADFEACEAQAGSLDTIDPGAADTAYYAGVDVARYGDDESAVSVRRGPYEIAFAAWHGNDTMETAARVRAVLRDLVDAGHDGAEAANVRVDTIGLGSGVADRLRELGYDVTDVAVSARSSDPTQWKSLRHELWWQHGQRFAQRVIAPAAGRSFDTTLRAQMTNVMYRYLSGSTKPVIEDKETLKKRTGWSPDRVEAQMLCYAQMPRRGRRRLDRSILDVGGGVSTGWIKT